MSGKCLQVLGAIFNFYSVRSFLELSVIKKKKGNHLCLVVFDFVSALYLKYISVEPAHRNVQSRVPCWHWRASPCGKCLYFIIICFPSHLAGVQPALVRWWFIYPSFLATLKCCSTLRRIAPHVCCSVCLASELHALYRWQVACLPAGY